MNRYLTYLIAVVLLLQVSGILKAQESPDPQFKVYSTSVVKRNGDTPLQIGMVELKDCLFTTLEGSLEFPGI